jgi:hypothetical protein
MVALNTEVPIMENEQADWTEKDENKIHPAFKLDEYFADRVKKPIDWEDLVNEDSDAEPEPNEIGRVSIGYFTKQRFKHIEKDTAGKVFDIKNTMQEMLNTLKDNIEVHQTELNRLVINTEARLDSRI